MAPVPGTVPETEHRARKEGRRIVIRREHGATGTLLEQPGWGKAPEGQRPDAEDDNEALE